MSYFLEVSLEAKARADSTTFTSSELKQLIKNTKGIVVLLKYIQKRSFLTLMAIFSRKAKALSCRKGC